MFKRYLLILAILALIASTMESCIFQKNRCDSCPGIVKRKKVHRSSKGSL